MQLRQAVTGEEGPASAVPSSQPHPGPGRVGSARPIVELRGVGMRFGSFDAVKDVNLAIERGEFFTLLGPSGSGKTTVLRILAGLLAPSAGSVIIEREDVSSKPPHRRNVGLVFQSLALFPHMSVYGNVAFPLRMQRVGRAETRKRVAEALELVRLSGIEERDIAELSGGQRQRVALARALVYRPPLLLLDEPLGALDRRLREDMQVEFMRLHQEIDVTMVNVTHDQREALMLSDRIGLLNEGRLVQVAVPEQLYREPADRFVASFLGDPSLIEGEVVNAPDGSPWFVRDALRVRVDAGTDPGDCVLVLRSEDVEISPTLPPPDGDRATVAARVELCAFEGLGLYYQVSLQSGGHLVNVFSLRGEEDDRLAPGDEVHLSWPIASANVLAG